MGHGTRGRHRLGWCQSGSELGLHSICVLSTAQCVFLLCEVMVGEVCIPELEQNVRMLLCRPSATLVQAHYQNDIPCP